MSFRSRVSVAVIVFAAAISTDAFAYRNSAWIPPWDGNALSSIQKNGSALSESNPVWYSWNADTSIAKNWNAENSTWRAAMTGSQLIPTVQNIINRSYDGGAAAAMLASIARRDQHVAAIAQLVVLNGFDGIDIDYEMLPASSRNDFTSFVSLLAQALHAANKKLSITVYAKTGEKDNWSGPGAEDWPALGAIADSVKIMAYDFHESSSGPGAITPLDWLDRIATYAQSTIPNDKIMIGLPWYGYDWGTTGASTLTYATAMTTAQNGGIAVTHDANGEATFTYGGHTVYFQDASSYAAKVALIKQKHSAVGGFAHWAAGMEDPAIWNAMRSSAANPAVPAGNSGSAATPVSQDFLIGGPSTVAATQGKAVSVDYQLTPINGFSETTNVSILSKDSFAGSAAVTATSVASGGFTTIRIVPSASAAAGVYRFLVRFASGSLVHEQPLDVRVVADASRKRAARL